ncbi:MAG: hypothetical protein GXP24_13120 [Planctomycetes bacterium]|nr:hypothetical protein [Planctomycetota bacterium]
MKRSLNLMSERAQKRGLRRGCLRLWTRIFSGVLFMLAVGGFTQWRLCHLEQVKQAAAEAEYEPIRQLKLENRRLRKQIAMLQKTERIPLELAKHQPLLGLVGLATQAVTKQDGKVYLQQIEIEREPLARETANSSHGQPTLSFALVGISIDGSAVTRLTDSLRELGPFVEVELITNHTSHVGKQVRQAFSIQCTN